LELQDVNAVWCAYCTLPAYCFLFLSTKSYLIGGEAPLLEAASAFLAAGVAAYHAWAAALGFWPWRPLPGGVESDLVAMPLTEGYTEGMDGGGT